MFSVWSQTLSNFKFSPKKQLVKSNCRLYLPLKLTQTNKQTVYKYLIGIFSAIVLFKHQRNTTSFSCILLQLELLANVFY